MSGMKPTVDTVAVQPVPAHWYYVLAGVGAILLLVMATAAVVLGCRRCHWASKKSSQQHSVTYRSSSQRPRQLGPQTAGHAHNLSYNLVLGPDHSHLYPGDRLTYDPALTIKLERDDSCDCRC